MLKAIVMLCFILNASMSIGQSNSIDHFNEAKRMMFNQQFESAISAFQSLKANPHLGLYAHFFQGLCYSENANYKKAIENWEVIKEKYPNWSQQEEVFYWLTLSYFELKEYDVAFNLSLIHI